MSAEMPKIPEPDHCLDSGSTPYYTADQMREYAQEAARQAMERCAEVCDDQEEPAWYGYENPHTFDDGKRACASAIRALSNESEKKQ